MRKKYRELPTQERLHELFHYNPETGVFTRRINRRKWKAGEVVGTLTKGYYGGYISINVDYVIYRAHRLAWVYVTGRWPVNGIDHINGDRADNRWANLREANQSQNLGNKQVQKNSQTGVKGVSSARGGKYAANLCKNRKRVYLGTFNTIAEAKAAYDAAAMIVHGDFFRS